MAVRQRTYLALIGLLVFVSSGWLGSACERAAAPVHAGVSPDAGSAAVGPQPPDHSNDPKGALPSQVLTDLTPIGPDTVWAVTESNQPTEIQRILRSTDRGARWSDVTPPGLRRATPKSTFGSAFFLNRRTGWITYGNGNTSPTSVIETTNAGHTWSKRSKLDTAGCQLQFVNADDGWCTALGGALGSEGVLIYYTTTGGRLWRLISATNPPNEKSTPGSLPFNCDKEIHFSTPTVAYAGFACAVGPPIIYASTDGGARWTRRSISLKGVPRQNAGTLVSAPLSVGADAAAGAWIGGYKRVSSRTLIFRSIDRGRRWQAVTPPGRPILWGADIVTPSVWRLTLDRTILATNNAGRTWTKIRSDKRLTTSTESTAIDFSTRLVGWDTSSGGPDLLCTTDGGQTWERVRLPGGSI